MLEQAAACLKFGAARNPLRCSLRPSRSQRLLHSTFWDHGAGDLDLPPWAVALLPNSDLPLRRDSDEIRATRGQRKPQAPAPSDGVFLDFLYPPHALAWLQRASQQSQKWEKRNVRRLPDGFVVAARGYASRSHARRSNAADAAHVQEHSKDESGEVYKPFISPQHGVSELSSSPKRDADQSEETEWSYDEARRHKGTDGGDADPAFAISPGDLAESVPNSLISLRNLLMFNRGKALLENSEAGRSLAERAWTMYQALDDDSRDDPKLKRELLEWYAMHQNETASSHREELFQSLPTGQKTLEIYDSMLSMYLRLERFNSATYLHHEALQTLQNGHVISRRLFEHSVKNRKWLLAMQTAKQHDSRYTELGQDRQIDLFWLNVSEMPQLLEHAMKLFYSFGGKEGISALDHESHSFVHRFFKAVFSQFATIVREAKDKLWLNALREPADQNGLVYMLRFVLDSESNLGKPLEDIIFALLSRHHSEYTTLHPMICGFYTELRKLPDIRPSSNLLSLFIYRLSYFEQHRDVNTSSITNVTARRVMDDWTGIHGKPSADAYRGLVGVTAHSGRAEEHEMWMREFRSLYPRYQEWSGSLWTLVHVYARRTNLDRAQQAFATVTRIMGEHDDEPDLRCWSALLNAHGRADDLDGAFTNFQSLTEKLVPDESCFAPIFWMLAKRGDVEGLEDFMDQFDQIVKAKRSTHMISHLMNAYIKQDNIEEAEETLKDAIQAVKKGEITGSLTRCFNCLLKANARRHDINAAMNTYQWMRRENVRLDSESFSAIMMVLANLRRHVDALRILRVDMQEHGVLPTAFHYAIVMQRLVGNTNYEPVLALHREMVERNIRPSVATNALMLKAKTLLENVEKVTDGNLLHDDGQQVPLESSIEALEEVLQSNEGEETAVHQFSYLVDMPDNTLADPGPYFTTLISVHGRRGCFEAVKALFARYKEAAHGRGGDESKLPINLTSSLMSAHWYAGDYAQVEEYWKLAKARADEISPPIPVPSFRYLVSEQALESADPLKIRPLSDPYPGPDLDSSRSRPVPNSPSTAQIKDPETTKQTLLTDTETAMKIRPAIGRRQMLNQPLRWYLTALHSQTRIIESIQTVSRLLTQGYTMDKNTWNVFICQLLDTTPPLALVAFTLTERFLTPGFPGWVRPSISRRPPVRRARFEGLEYINARYVESGRLMPQYRTLVRLAAALLDVRRLESQGRKGLNTNVPPELQKFIGTTREIRKMAAKTLHVVQSMPYIAGDKTQEKYLRRRSE